MDEPDFFFGRLSVANRRTQRPHPSCIRNYGNAVKGSLKIFENRESLGKQAVSQRQSDFSGSSWNQRWLPGRTHNDA
jgi:hypothetical protein